MPCIKAWQQTPDGKGVTFTQSYGASGDQARRSRNGLKADIVQLSTGLDVDCSSRRASSTRSGTSSRTTASSRTRSSSSPLRPGNPKKIKGWNDLSSPASRSSRRTRSRSGAAKWNMLAAYGAQRRLGKTDKQAQRYVLKLFKNVVVQDNSGRNATNTFLSGKGDVLLTYENEAIASRKNGQDIQYVIPRQTMLIELPIAVLKTSENKDKANKFIRFTKTAAAQRICAEYGFRPVEQGGRQGVQAKFPARPDASSRINDKNFGGWASGRQAVVRPEGRHHGRAIEKAVGGPPLASVAAAAPRARQRPRHREGRAGNGPLPRLRHDATCR